MAVAGGCSDWWGTGGWGVRGTPPGIRPSGCPLTGIRTFWRVVCWPVDLTTLTHSSLHPYPSPGAMPQELAQPWAPPAWCCYAPPWPLRGPHLAAQTCPETPPSPPAQPGLPPLGVAHRDVGEATWEPKEQVSGLLLSLCSPRRLLSNNKIAVLENGSFLGLRLLEKL